MNKPPLTYKFDSAKKKGTLTFDGKNIEFTGKKAVLLQSLFNNPDGLPEQLAMLAYNRGIILPLVPREVCLLFDKGVSVDIISFFND